MSNDFDKSQFKLDPADRVVLDKVHEELHLLSNQFTDLFNQYTKLSIQFAISTSKLTTLLNKDYIDAYLKERYAPRQIETTREKIQMTF